MTISERSGCRSLLLTSFSLATQVNSWLSTVFGDQPAPHFEVNTRTVDILYQVAQSSEARCSDTALLTEDLKQKASEYEADGGYLSWQSSWEENDIAANLMGVTYK